MEILDLYPEIFAEPLAGGRKENLQTYYLFNSKINRGYVVDGLAALFCRKIDGKKTLRNLIEEFENEYELEKGKFHKEINDLIHDLEKNHLLNLLKTPKGE